MRKTVVVKICAKRLLLSPSICFSRSLFYKERSFLLFKYLGQLPSIRSHRQLLGSLLDSLADVLDNNVNREIKQV